MRRIYWTFSLAVGTAFAGAVLSPPLYAKDLSVVVVAGGEAYKGPPRFRLLADNRAIGEADVDNALQPKEGQGALGGQSPTLNSVKSSLRKFSFNISNGDSVSQYSIQYLNDAWGGPGSTLDRNLWVSELIVNGQHYAAEKLVGDGQTSKIANGLAILLSNGSLTLKRPANGWQTSTVAQENTAGTQKSTAEAKKSSQTCESIEPLLVLGYGIGQIDIPGDQEGKVSHFAATSMGSGCSITVTGLTTAGGSVKGNRVVGTARANAVKERLAKAGVNEIRTELNLRSKDRGVLLTARSGK